MVKNMCIIGNLVKRKLCGLLEDESGMGVVEIVLIIIVLVGLVVLFKEQITSIVKTILAKMSSQINKI